MLAITSNKNTLLANLLVTLQIQTRIKTIEEQFSPIPEDQLIYLKLVKPS